MAWGTPYEASASASDTRQKRLALHGNPIEAWAVPSMGFRPCGDHQEAPSRVAEHDGAARVSVALRDVAVTPARGEASTPGAEQEPEAAAMGSTDENRTKRLKTIARQNRKRHGRRLVSKRDIAERALSQVDVRSWVSALRDKMGGSCAEEAAALEQGSFVGASTTSMIGVGGGVGAPIPPNGVEPSPAKEGQEITEKVDGASQEGLRDQNIPAGQRRVEPETTSIQKMFIPIIESDPFYWMVMGAIAVNCIQLAIMSPLDPSPDPQAMQDADVAIDWILFVVFTIEFILKHLALYPRGYWSDSWNKLDGTIVLVGYLKFIPGVGDYAAIRVLRIIRPLRVIGKLEGMKKIMVTIGSAMAGLVDTLLLCCLIFFMFGIIGCTLFAGVTRHRCYTPTTVGNVTTYAMTDVERPCGGWYECETGDKCFFWDGGNGADRYANAVPSIVNFDNILIGFLTLFVMITLEGWVDVMYLIQDGYGFWASSIVFHFLILLGSLFTLNLALAVISDAYENQEEDWEAAERECCIALRHVQLADEAIALENLSEESRLLRQEKDGLENAMEFADTPAELKSIEDELETTIDSIKDIANKVTQMADVLDAEKDGCCSNEASMMRPVADLMLESLEEEEEDEELTFDQQQEIHRETRVSMASWQAGLHVVATSDYFDKLIMFFIIFNTLVLAMEHTEEAEVDGILQAVEMSQSQQDALTGLNYLFIVVFTIEVVVKLPGLGARAYFKDSFNCFDIFIVIMSYVELAFADNSSLSALRTFRLARVFKLAKNWKSLRDLINTIIATLPAMSYLSVLQALFMFIASVAGMMFFGGKFKVAVMDEEDGRRNQFDNFGIAMLTVFQMLTGENWNSVLNDGIRWGGGEGEGSWGSVPYFLIVQLLGNFIILNLFLAILLSNFGEDGATEGEDYPQMADMVGMCFTSSKVEPENNQPESNQVSAKDEPVVEGHASTPLQDSDTKSDEVVGNGTNTEPEAGKGAGSGVVSPREEAGAKAVRDFSDPSSRSIAAINAEIRRKDEEEKAKPATVLVIEDMDVQGNALYCFPHDDSLRRNLALLVGWSPKGQEPRNTWFANFIFLMIIISSITLALDTPGLDKDSDLKTTLNILDIIFTVIFTVEMLMKMIVYGFVFTPDAYMKDGWNGLDFFIVITSIVALPSNAALGAGDDSPVASLRVLRTFRALRPLRMINRAPGLKVVVDAIFKCLPAFFNIALVTWLVYLVFAIMGVQLWAGKFWYCTDGDVDFVHQCNGTMADGTVREWKNKPLNFDDVLQAQLTLYEVASLEIWLDVMYAAMDVPEKLGENPKKNQSWVFSLYFVVFIVIGSFLMMNLFVGAVVDNFNRIKNEMDKKGAIMTDEQEAFVKSMKTMFNKKPAAKPQAPDKNDGFAGYFRYKVFKFITFDPLTKSENDQRRKEGLPMKRGETPLFDHVIMFLIACNILIMAAPIWEYPGAGIEVGTKADIEAQKTEWNKGLELGNAVFNFLFVVECILKLTGLGPRQYFASGMNIFDFCIVTVSVMGFIVDQALEDVDPGLISIISVIKAGRVVRIFRLAMRVKGIRKQLETLVYTLPSLTNVAALLAIILFIFTVLGMAFFGDQQYDQPPFELYTVHANFRSFWVGFFCLFRMSTGESWNGIMHDSMDNVSKYSWIYYVAYMIIGSSLLFQLIVAVVLEQFSSAQAEEESVVTPNDIDLYAATWQVYDPGSTHLIDFGQLPIFLKNCGTNLGVKQGHDATTKEVMDFMTESQLMSHGGKAHYVETFFSLVMYAYKVKYKNRWKGTLDEDILMEMTQQLTAGFPSIEAVDSTASDSATQNFAALKIQSITRKRQAHKRSAAKREEKGLPALEASTAPPAAAVVAAAAAPIPPVPPMPAPKPAGSALDSPRVPGPPPSMPPTLPQVAPAPEAPQRDAN